MNASATSSFRPGRSKGAKKQDQGFEKILLELVGNTTQQRNWRGIIIALLVIVTVLGLIVTAIVLVTPKETDEVTGQKISFKSFVQHQYEPREFHPVWGEDDTFVFRNSDGAVVRFYCSDNSTRLVMDNSTFRMLDTGQYSISPDGKKVLLPYDIQHKYRYSYLAKYKIYDISTKIDMDLIGPKIDKNTFQGESFQYVTWAPKGHGLIAVQNNNIYFYDMNRNINRNAYQQLTYDGIPGSIYNGVPDWLYEEEILQSEKALWWSPDGSRLLYGAFNESDVKRYNMTMYGPMKNKYVEDDQLPYPKPNTPNPRVQLKVYNFIDNSTIILRPPRSLERVDHYFTRVTWKDSNHVLVTWLNRPQNVSIMSLCNVQNSTCSDNFRVESERGWLMMDSEILAAPEGDAYYVILPQKDGDYGSFRHIARINSTSLHHQGTKMFLTSGRMEVKKIVGYDRDTKTIYFLAVKQADPREKHLYSVTTVVQSEGFRKEVCLSCEISPTCLYVDALFSRSGKFYILGCLGPDIPFYHLMKSPNTFVNVLEDNQPLRHTVSTLALPKTEFVEIETANEDVILAKLLLPPILKKDEIITYNLLMKVYGSPNTQLVTHKFEIGWEHFQCSMHDIIIAFVDGRGSGGRGDDWLHSTYKKLGTLEAEDTLYAARHFKSLKYVNDKTAIWGVSHGGFLTSAIMARSDNLFNCGIAVAPVTDWRYYDSFYTEKFMGLPTEYDNLEGYNQANISRYASNFKKSKFMLVHGTGDDNVHFQHSAQLMKALTAHDVYFRTQIYTDQKHSLNGGNTRTHLYNSMEDFLFTCFGKVSSRREADQFEVEKDDEEVQE